MARTKNPSTPVPGSGFRLVEFTVYRWNDPETDSEYPYLAAPADRSSLLSFGNSGIYFDIEFPRDGHRWLDHDYVPIKDHIYFDMTSWIHAIEKPFPGGIYFGMLRVNRSGRPLRLELSTKAQRYADEGPEYELSAPGQYRRWHNANRAYGELSTDEQQMLDRGLQVMAPLIAQVAEFIHADPPPRFCANQSASALADGSEGGSDENDAITQDAYGGLDSGPLPVSQ